MYQRSENMKGNLLYIIFVNSKGNKIVVDYKTTEKDIEPEVGYVTEFEDWKTDNEDWLNDCIFFDGYKAFPTSGMYVVDGNVIECSEPECGWYVEYNVIAISKIVDLPYNI
jgi:hypothetical protein